MKKKCISWIISIVLILFIIGFYLFNSYNNMFESRMAYLYDPVSDDVFKVELAPNIHEYNKWAPFNPFKSLNYTSSIGAENLGKLESIITEHQESMKLLSEDFDAWEDKMDRDLDSIKQHFADNNYAHEFWNVEYFINSDSDYINLLSNTFPEIFNSDEINENEIIVVDAIVAKTIIQTKGSFKRKTSMQIIHEAILFRGKAANLLNMHYL